MQRNMKAWMHHVLNTPQRVAVPVLTYPAAAMAGLNILEIVRKAEAHYACVKVIVENYPTAAAVTCMDLSVEAEAFGSQVAFTENEVPTVIEGVMRTIDEVEKVIVPDITKGRALEYVKAAGLTARAVNDRPTLAGMIGPVSLAGRLFDMTEMMVALMLEPEKTHVLLEKSTRYLVAYAQAFKAAGAHGILIAEPAAGLLSPQQCHAFSSHYVKMIVDAVQDEHFMVILHNCGQTINLVESMLSTGCMGYHFGNAVDMTRILPQIPAGAMALGNIDPVGVMKNGTATQVRERTQALLKKTAGYPNFVLSTGCDVPPGTPRENLDAFFLALEDFNTTERVGKPA